MLAGINLSGEATLALAACKMVHGMALSRAGYERMRYETERSTTFKAHMALEMR